MVRLNSVLGLIVVFAGIGLQAYATTPLPASYSLTIDTHAGGNDFVLRTLEESAAKVGVQCTHKLGLYDIPLLVCRDETKGDFLSAAASQSYVSIDVGYNPPPIAEEILAEVIRAARASTEVDGIHVVGTLGNLPSGEWKPCFGQHCPA